jgi:large repetitive protein
VVQNGIVKLKAVLKGTGVFDQTLDWKLTGTGTLSATVGLDVEYTAPSVVTDDVVVLIKVTPKADPSLVQELAITLRSKTFVTMYSFSDLDFDNVRDLGELPIADVKFTLKNDAGVVVNTTQTDATGKAVFRDLKPEVYRIEQTIPAGYGTSADTNTGRLPLTVGAQALSKNFGLTTGEIRGQVYVDINFDEQRGVALDARDNLQRDSSGNFIYGEPGVSTTLELTGKDVNGNDVTRKILTDTDGRFAFKQLPAGTYVVTEIQPEKLADWKDTVKPNGTYPGLEVSNLAGITISHDGPSRKDTTSPITLATGELKGTLFFGESDLIITGWAYIDQNRNGFDKDINGSIEDSTGIANIKLKLIGQATNTRFPGYGTGFLAEATTDSKGNYFFEGVPYGIYTVQEVNPLGFGTGHARTVVTANFGRPIPGNSQDVEICRRIDCPVVPYPIYFGDTLSTLTGTVFLDDSNDGILDASEPGLILNVPVTLVGTDVAGKSVSLSTRIGENGKYEFSQVLAGEYKLEISEQPPGYTRGKLAAGQLGTTTVGTVTSTSINNIVLPVDADGTGYNFGYLRP